MLGLYKLPEMHEEFEAERTSGAALVLPAADRTAEVRDAQFYQTACRYRGWYVRVFSTQEKAIEWLNSK